jgi:hypothetical protein
LKRVLFDSDVLLDVLAQRQPFVLSSARALNTVTQEEVQGYVSGHAVRDIRLNNISSNIASKPSSPTLLPRGEGSQIQSPSPLGRGI